MKTSKKILLIIATALVGVGIITGIVGFGLTGGDIMAFNMTKNVTNSYEVSDGFLDIYIESGTADVNILASDDGVCRVNCEETDNLYHTVTVENGTLKILKKDIRKWYHHIGIFWGKMEITVYLPEEAYTVLTLKGNTGNVKMSESLTFGVVDIEADTGDIDVYSKVIGQVAVSTDTGKININNAHVDSLKAKASTGKVTVVNSEANTLTIKTSTGKVYLKDVTCRNMHAETSTGGVSAENVIADVDAVIRCSTGDVKLVGFDAQLINIKTDTGDVYGELLSDKIFTTETDTGKVNVPRSEQGGRCDVLTDTGNIEFKINKR